MTDFYVGQKVVCVDGSPPLFPNEEPGRVVEGSIYVIRDFDLESQPYGICLEGFFSAIPTGYHSERGWNHTRFRPLDERKTDISIFTKILNDVRSKEPVSTS